MGTKTLDFNKLGASFSYGMLNRGLLLIIIALWLYLAIDFLVTTPEQIEQDINAPQKLSTAGLVVPVQANDDDFLPVEYYSNPVASRNLFTVEAESQGTSTPSATFMEMVAKLKLQGVISQPHPQAIIEDTKTRELYFLAPGEHIGEIEVIKVLPGKVILGYQGQETELSI